MSSDSSGIIFIAFVISAAAPAVWHRYNFVKRFALILLLYMAFCFVYPFENNFLRVLFGMPQQVGLSAVLGQGGFFFFLFAFILSGVSMMAIEINGLFAKGGRAGKNDDSAP